MIALLKTERTEHVTTDVSDGEEIAEMKLAQLPIGARLLLECRKDWRAASVAYISATHVTLNVCAPSGRTYHLRRQCDLPVAREGGLLILGAHKTWRIHLCRYDLRW